MNVRLRTALAATAALAVSAGIGVPPALAAPTPAATSSDSWADPANPLDLALPVVDSPAEQQIERERQVAATQLATTGSSSVDPMTLQPTSGTTASILVPGAPNASTAPATLGASPNNLPGGSMPTSLSLASGNHVTQETDYYCGPAAVLQILRERGNTTATQGGLATALGTTPSGGTGFSGSDPTGSSGYPVQDVLNNRLSSQGANYGHVRLMNDATITSAVTTTYENELTADIYDGWELAGNIYINQGDTDRPSIYPQTMFIGHWVTLSGYSNGGATTQVQDPAAGMPESNWQYVTNTWNAASTDMLAYMHPRGYIW